MTQESLCPICKKKIETLTRCFRDCDRVRKRINDYVFGQKWTSEEGIINNVQAMMHDLRRLNEELDVLQSSMMVNDSTSKSYWSPPCPGVFKVNCDGVVFIHEAIATSKLWSIFYGMRLAEDCGVQHIIMESDSAEAVNHLMEHSYDNHLLFHLVQEIKR
ncbi:hypothetical protein HKD37_12G033306 [Glycine soja]